MPFVSVTLVPGVNVERTPTLLRAGYSRGSLIRFRDGLVQKYGGWSAFYPFTVGGVPRDLHAWEDLNGAVHLGVGTTTALDVITSNVLQNITPETLTSDFAYGVAFSTTANSQSVSITDPNISNVTVEDAVFFNVPVSIGGLILDGLYAITQINGVHSYQITAASNATSSSSITAIFTNGSPSIGATASNFFVGQVVQFTTTGALPSGFAVLTNYYVIATGLTSSAFEVSATPGGLAITAGSAGTGTQTVVQVASIPVFTTINGSPIVNVNLTAHGQSAGSIVVFEIPTTGNGVTITSAYDVVSVTNANNFSISVAQQATSSGSFTMNAGNAELVYYISLGPPPAGSGFGLGGFGSGGFGTGSTVAAQTGNPITATDWTLDNWGQILLACPRGGAIYYWDPTGGFNTATAINTGPVFNNGMFVSTSQQIVIAWGSSIHQGIGYQKQPMLVQWCDASNFFQWTPATTTQAGNFVIPIGSQIMGGLAVGNQNLIWTDLDVWSMSYIGPELIYSFNKIGAGAGLASAHAAQQLRGNVYWMGQSNFYIYSGGGVSVLPCPVWDAVFQNINTAYLQNIRPMPNTPFNEAGWFYPSAASVSGENDSYVKVNILDGSWDNGPYGSPQTALARSAWIDQSVLGMPIAATSNGTIYQHESTMDAAGQPLVSTFLTGYFYIAESEDFAFVDQIIPDFKFQFFDAAGNSAQIQISFLAVNYPGDTPIVYGPYTVISTTEYISVRIRSRMMAIQVTSQDSGSWWRLGNIRIRAAPDGRR